MTQMKVSVTQRPSRCHRLLSGWCKSLLAGLETDFSPTSDRRLVSTFFAPSTRKRLILNSMIGVKPSDGSQVLSVKKTPDSANSYRLATRIGLRLAEQKAEPAS